MSCALIELKSLITSLEISACFEKFVAQTLLYVLESTPFSESNSACRVFAFIEDCKRFVSFLLFSYRL